MKLKKIQQIKNVATFNNFLWEIPEDYSFGKFNLFYGWNGSGKTTISRIIASLAGNDKDFLNDNSEIVITTDIGNVNINKFTSEIFDNILVFNEDFIKENISFKEGKTSIILMVDKKKIKQKAQLENVKTAIEKNKKDKSNFEEELRQLEKEKENVLKKSRDLVKKEMLSYVGIKPIGERVNEYNNYNIVSVESVLQRDICPEEDIENYEKLKKILSERSVKNKIDEIVINLDWLDNLLETADNIFSFSPQENFLKSIIKISQKEKKEVFEWIQIGFQIHKDDKEPRKCKFCNNIISQQRFFELEKIFNNDLQNVLNNIKSAIETINLKQLPVAPSSSIFYKDLEQDYQKKLEEYNSAKQQLFDSLSSLKNNLLTKKQNLSTDISFNKTELQHIKQRILNAVKEINLIISKHNKRTNEFDTKRKEAAHQLEILLVCKNKEQYNFIVKKMKHVKQQIKNISLKQKELEEKEAELKKELSDYGIGARELEKKLQSFLGRNNIFIDISEDDEGAYLIKREDGSIAKYLSEGERNAIALIFFLAKLNEEGFDAGNGIVVIDDPISSFDYQNFFQAFAFVKSELLKIKPGQIFILTHNFQFFKHLQNWFYHEDRRGARYYIVKNIASQGNRSSKIKKIDKFLLNNNSEYSYIFKLVYKKAFLERDNDLEKDYILPNVIRKLLEGFLSFRVPKKIPLNRKLRQVLEDSGFNPDNAVRHRLEKYCHDGSHSIEQRSVSDMDEVLAGEIKYVCKDCMELIKNVDEKHFLHLENEINNNEQ